MKYRFTLSTRMLPCLIAVTGAMAISPARAQVAGSVVTFGFKRPDNVQYVETLKKIQKIRSASTLKTIVHKTSFAMFTHKKATGYEIVETPLATSGSVDGKPMPPSPSLSAQGGMPVTFVLDEQGRLVQVRGVEEFLRRFQRKYDAAKVKPLVRLDAPETIALAKKNQATAWNVRYADLIGRTVSVGESWPNDAMETFPVAEPSPSIGRRNL